MQFGGSDQWGNITAGVELIRRADGGHVHALATPLLTKADGTKFGKTEGGAIWLDPTMTSPYAFHQYFLNAEDSKVIEYLKVFSERPRAEIEEIERETLEAPERRVRRSVRWPTTSRRWCTHRPTGTPPSQRPPRSSGAPT